MTTDTFTIESFADDAHLIRGPHTSITTHLSSLARAEALVEALTAAILHPDEVQHRKDVAERKRKRVQEERERSAEEQRKRVAKHLAQILASVEEDVASLDIPVQEGDVIVYPISVGKRKDKFEYRFAHRQGDTFVLDEVVYPVKGRAIEYAKQDYEDRVIVINEQLTEFKIARKGAKTDREFKWVWRIYHAEYSRGGYIKKKAVRVHTEGGERHAAGDVASNYTSLPTTTVEFDERDDATEWIEAHSQGSYRQSFISRDIKVPVKKAK